MPSKNSIKQYADESYYHIYNRGVNRRKIFVDNEDYIVFLALLKRYLSPKATTDIYKRTYPNYANELDLLAFCLMPNHFHLFVFQHDAKSIESLMRSVATSYTAYFNKKYKRIGHLFQGTYKAARISSPAYLLHITRYIHLNPKLYKEWSFSSYPYYVRKKQAEWVKPHRVLELFEGDSYESFTDDYAAYKETLEEIKYEIADR